MAVASRRCVRGVGTGCQAFRYRDEASPLLAIALLNIPRIKQYLALPAKSTAVSSASRCLPFRAAHAALRGSDGVLQFKKMNSLTLNSTWHRSAHALGSSALPSAFVCSSMNS